MKVNYEFSIKADVVKIIKDSAQKKVIDLEEVENLKKVDKLKKDQVLFYSDDKAIHYIANYNTMAKIIKVYLMVYEDKSYKFKELNKTVDFVYNLSSWSRLTDLDSLFKGLISRPCFATQAVKNFETLLKDNYTDQELIEVFKSHQAERSKPLHCHLNTETNIIAEVRNVHYYDINKAYPSALGEIFTKIRPQIEKDMLKYKEDPTVKSYYKKLYNIVIGCMCSDRNDNYKKYFSKKFPYLSSKDFNNLRYYIVDSITEKVQKLCFELDGQTIYENTDGIIVKDPKNIVENSDELGKFKKEVIDNDTIWFLRYIDDDTTYTIMQWFENGQKVIKSIGGWLDLDELYNNTDLSKNQAVSFKRDPDGNIENIKKVVLKNELY